jgi:hypothetical protein
MSYKYRVLADRPVGYWRLQGSLVSDETATANTGFIGSGSDPVFSNIVPIASNDYVDTNINACKIIDTSSIQINNIYDFFYKGYEKKSFGIEFLTILKSNPSEKTSFITIKNGASIIAELYAEGDQIFYKVNGVDASDLSTLSYTTSKQLISWESKSHIFALYKEKQIQIMVNGLSQETINLPLNFMFDSIEGVPLDIIVGPAPTSEGYIISDIALYDRALSLNEIRSHMFWSNRDSDPKYYVQQGSAYHFNINNQENMFISRKYFTSKDAYDAGYYDGLISDASGLTIKPDETGGSAVGSWLYNFPISEYQEFAGININWDTASVQQSLSGINYSRVLVSYDNGSTYYQTENGKSVPMFLSTASDLASSNLLVKIEIHSSDISAAIQPRIDNLFIGLYNSINISADAGGFILSPFASTTYMIKKNDNPVINRSRNLGINFSDQSGTELTGTALISSYNSTPYQSIEFWFKYDGAGSVILDAEETMDVEVYIDIMDNKVKNNLGSGKIYINGTDQTLGNFIITENEIYHFLICLDASRENQIYLNGTDKIGYDPCQASYGYITVYPGTFNLTEAENRYLSYLTVKSAIVYDHSTSLGSIAEYYGSSTGINGGLAVIANGHVY